MAEADVIMRSHLEASRGEWMTISNKLATVCLSVVQAWCDLRGARRDLANHVTSHFALCIAYPIQSIGAFCAETEAIQ